MPRPTKFRELDLSAAKPTKAKPGRPPITVGGLSLRQMQQHQRAIVAVSRWTTRLKRAANEVTKHQKTVQRYERLIAKNAPQ